jgi:putative transposase
MVPATMSAMPRAPRNIAPDLYYHVMNRANDGQRLFARPQDYQAFVGVLTEALSRFDVELFCWCVMPDEWHLVLRPRARDALQTFMRWLTHMHVRRHPRRGKGESEPFYQGRYRSFPVEEGAPLLLLCRYLEGGARRAKLVTRAEDWRWASLKQRAERQDAPPLAEWPVDRPATWLNLVNGPLADVEEEQIRVSIRRDRPLGSPAWVRRTAAKLGLTQTLRPRGRPPKPLAKLSPRQRRGREAAMRST